MDQIMRRYARWLAAGLAAAAVFAVLITLAISAAPPGTLPPVKQTHEASIEQTRVAASLKPQPPPGPSPVPATIPAAQVPRRPAGAGNIVTDFVPPFPAMSHIITSMWYAETGGTRLIVYAGALRDDPGVQSSASQGVVIVVVQTMEGASLPGGGTYLAPGKTGPLRITDANGVRLVLQSDSGGLLYFDVSTRQFVSSQ
jgi:hypothetical protein